MLSTLTEVGHIVQNAAVFNPRNWEGTPMNADSLPQTVRRLFSLLAERQIEYVLVGGIALLNYVEGRNTQDVDLIMSLPGLTNLPEISVETQEMYFARGVYQDLQVDILLTENPLFHLVRQKFTANHTFWEQTIPLATVDGLLLLKMYALPSLYRQGDFMRVSLYENDIASLIYAYQPDMPKLLDILPKYLGESDINTVREIVEETEQRIQRFNNERKS